MGQSGGTGVGCVVESSGHIGSGGGVVWHELHVGLVGLSEIYSARSTSQCKSSVKGERLRKAMISWSNGACAVGRAKERGTGRRGTWGSAATGGSNL